jgi:hypothetical protein
MIIAFLMIVAKWKFPSQSGSIIINMQLGCEKLKLESLIEYFYAIPGVPSEAVKPEQLRLEHHKVFIQSTSQGSRCLKKGTRILYLKEVVTAHISYTISGQAGIFVNKTGNYSPYILLCIQGNGDLAYGGIGGGEKERNLYY